MAGSPRKSRSAANKAKHAAAQAAKEAERAQDVAQLGDVPDAVVSGDNTRPRHTRTRARTGTRTRAAADSYQAQRFTAAAGELGNAIAVRIHRMRPAWCAGFLEDWPLDAGGGMAGLLEYLRDEHGGQLYRVEVLGPDGDPLHEVRLPVAGPPRELGRVIDRGRYEGAMRGDVEPATVAVAPAPAAPSSDPLVAMLVKSLVEGQTRDRNSSAELMREHSQQTINAVREVAQLVAQRQTEEQRQSSFAGQLQQFREGLEALDEVRDAIVATVPEGDDDARRDTSATRSFAMDQFLAQAAQSMSGRKERNTAPATQQRRPAQPAGPAPARVVRRGSKTRNTDGAAG